MRFHPYSSLSQMAIPYGLAQSVHGSPDKKKTWELVIFEDSTMKTCAHVDVVHEVHTRILQAARDTHSSFLRDGVLRLTSARGVCARALEQSIRRWCAGSILRSCFSYLACAPTTKVVQLCLTEGCLQNPGSNPMPSSIMSGCPRRALRLRNQAGLQDSLLRF